MKATFKTLDEANLFIEHINTLLGFPDGNGTETYAEAIEILEKDEDDNDVIIGYEVPIDLQANTKIIELYISSVQTNTVIKPLIIE